MNGDFPKLLDVSTAAGALGLAKSALHARIRSGLFPTPNRLNSRLTRWAADEVASVVRAHAAGLPDDAVRALVQRLHAARERAARELMTECVAQ